MSFKTKSTLTIKTLFILLTFASLSCTATQTFTDQELESLTSTKTIPELQSLMVTSNLTPSRLTEFYIKKIESKDHLYNSVLQINPTALAQAKHLDKKLPKTLSSIPALFGMPILLKDNIENSEQATTAGSLLLQNNYTNRDATLVAKLREHGAIILGKTNLSEWANFRSERSSSGWSAVGGQTKNPYDVTRTPCGSSAGSGAAIAANFAVAAIGTETNGSITCPAAINGVVGVKPTVGLVSRFGVVPISPSQDTAGPMTKNVVDAQRVLFAMQGVDNKDKATKEDGLKLVSSDVAVLNVSNLKLGVITSSAENHEQVKALFNDFKTLLNSKHIKLVNDLSFESYDGFWQDGYSQLLREFKTALNHYFANLPDDVPNELNTMTLEGVIQFNKANKSKEMQYFQQEIFIKSQKTDGMNTNRYRNLKKKLKRVTGQENIDKLIKENKLDALIAVTRGPAWKIDLVNGDHSNGGVSSFSAIAGYPHVTIPMAKLHGLPIGVSIMTRHGEDYKALQVAFALEQVIKQN